MVLLLHPEDWCLTLHIAEPCIGFYDMVSCQTLKEWMQLKNTYYTQD